MDKSAVWQKTQEFVKKDYLHLIKVGLIIVLIVISNSSSTSLHNLQGYLKTDRLADTNQNYLQEVQKRAFDDFLVLSEMSVFLNVIGSSQIGISFIAEFNVTVGRSVHELTEVVERAALVSMGSMLVTKLISRITSAGEAIVPFLLQLWLWFVLGYLLLDLLKKKSSIPDEVVLRSEKIAMSLLLVLIFFHIVLPYSIHLSSIASVSLVHQDKGEASNNLSAIHGHLLLGGKQKELRGTAEDSIKRLKNVSKKDLKQKITGVLDYILSYFTLSILELIIFPVLIMYGTYRFFRYLILHSEMQ